MHILIQLNSNLKISVSTHAPNACLIISELCSSLVTSMIFFLSSEFLSWFVGFLDFCVLSSKTWKVNFPYKYYSRLERWRNRRIPDLWRFTSIAWQCLLCGWTYCISIIVHGNSLFPNLRAFNVRLNFCVLLSMSNSYPSNNIIISQLKKYI